MSKKQLTEISVIAGIILLAVVISATAGTLNFVWQYTAKDQKTITRFELVRDNGDQIVVSDIKPSARAVSYDEADLLGKHVFGLRACNGTLCSKISNLVVVMPPVPVVPTGFKIK